MASVQFEIDFGEPEGTLEEMGLEDCTCAQDVIDILKKESSSPSRALEAWNLLDYATVRVHFYPDPPEELDITKAGAAQEELIAHPNGSIVERFNSWRRDSTSHAEWSGW